VFDCDVAFLTAPSPHLALGSLLTGSVKKKVWLLLYAHRHRRILGTAGQIILTQANHLMVIGLKIWSLSNPGSNQRPFDHWPTS
jgi:hypothetical protein